MIHTDNRPIKYITPRESMELCRALAVDQLAHLREAKESAFGHLVPDDLIVRTERIIELWDERLNAEITGRLTADLSRSVQRAKRTRSTVGLCLC